MGKNDGMLGRNVLVLRFSALGDIAMTIPALYPICKAHPDTRFVMVTKPWPASMFHDRPANLVVLGIDVKQEYKGVLGLMKLASRLHSKYGIDAVADLHNVLRTRIIGLYMQLRGIPIARLDKQRAQRRALVRHTDNQAIVPTHYRYCQVFSKLGFEATAKFTRLYAYSPLPVSPIVLDKEPGQRWIAIAPFSAHHGKNYPLGHMAQVVEGLSQHDNYWIFLMGGGKAEKAALAPITRNNKHVISMAEVKHGFIDEYALLSKCDLMVTMDSANMHIASLVGLKAVTIWGATSPSCGFQGYGQQSDDDIQLDLDCRPCSIYGERKCRYGDYHCLNDISPERVINHVVNIVERIKE